MNCRVLIALAVALGMVALTDTTFIEGTITVSVAAAAYAAAAAAATALLAGAALVAKGRSRRGKREAVSCLPVANPEFYLSMAANGDFLDCGRRLVCELEATDDDYLAEEEAIIKELFSRGSTSLNGTAGTFYTEAGQVGKNGGVPACKEAFSRCPFSRKEIFLAFQKSKNGQ